MTSETKITKEALEKIEEIYETDYEIGQDNVERFGFDMHNPVFFVSALLILLFVLLSLMFPESSKSVLEATRTWIQEVFDWLFLSAGNFFVLFCIALILLPVVVPVQFSEEAKAEHDAQEAAFEQQTGSSLEHQATP